MVFGIRSILTIHYNTDTRPLTSATMNLTQHLVILALIVLVTIVPHIPGQHGSVQKPTRFYIGGVLSSTAMARAFTMEAQVIISGVSSQRL